MHYSITSQIFQEGRFWIVEYKTSKEEVSITFTSESKARKFYKTL